MDYSFDIKDNEDNLIEAILDNQRWAQKELYEKYYEVLMPICLRYVGTRREAEDVLHESYIKIFKNIYKFKIGTSLKAWMSRIVINTSIDQYRKISKKKTVNLDVVYHLKTKEPSVLQALSAEEILDALHKLTRIYRTIFNMFVVEGYSHKEIANKLSISESTSRSNLVKARKKLKEILLSKDKFYD